LALGLAASPAPARTDVPAVATAAAASSFLDGYEFVDLGPDMDPVAINSKRQIVVYWTHSRPSGNGTLSEGALWEDGTLTVLNSLTPTPSEGVPHSLPADINDAGRILGTGIGGSGSGGYQHAAWWDVSDPSVAHDLGTLPNGNNLSAAQQENAAGDAVVSSPKSNGTGADPWRAFLTRKAAPSQEEIGTAYPIANNEYIYPCGISDAGKLLMVIAGKTYLLDTPGATGIELPFAVYCSPNAIVFYHPMGPDGSVVGATQGTASAPAVAKLRKPDGTIVSLGEGDTDPSGILLRYTPRSVNNGLIVGEAYGGSRAGPVAYTDGAWVDLTPLAPSGFKMQSAYDVNANGDIVGAGIVGSVKHGYLLKAPARGITGHVLRGTAPGKPLDPPVPAQGVLVKVKGKTAAGAAFSETATSDAAGAWKVDAPKGSYTVTFPAGVCAAVPGKACVQRAKAEVSDASAPVVDAIALAGDLAVKVTYAPKKIELKRNAKTGKVEPQDVTVTAVVKNTGKAAVTNVTAFDKLVIGYHDPQDVNVPVVPLRPQGGPKPDAKIGTLKPGKSAKVTYKLLAKGDGAYDVDSVFTGKQPGVGNITGRGTTVVKVGSPVLDITTSMGREEKRPHGLIKAGSPFTIKLKVRNLSFVKKIAVEPFSLGLKGNAYDGHVEGAGYAIGDVSAVSSVRPSQWIVLPPRRTVQLEGYVRTTSLPAEVVSTGKEVGLGGTRARVTVPEPTVHVIDKGDVLGAEIKGAAVNIDGDTQFEIGIDDSDFRDEPRPFNYLVASYYLTDGVFTGIWNMTAGAVKGLLVDLPILVAKGIGHIPSALQAYLKLEVDLWGAIRDDPALVLAYTNVVTNQVLLAYKEAPFLIKKGSQLYEDVNKEVFAHYEKMWNNYYSGDWTDALREFAREGTERTADVALALAPGILTRLPKVRAAFAALKDRVYAGVTEDLAAYAPRVLGAFEVQEILAKVFKPGLEMTDAHLRAFFGLTQRETDFLRKFAKDNKLLLVVRSRAAESVKWLKAYGAVLKPEAIKLKNVSFTDWKWLGYPRNEIGRVAIKAKEALPSEHELIDALKAAGKGPDDPEYVEAIDRLHTRLKEFEKDANGYVKQLEEIAKPKPPSPDGELTLNWNFVENAVDASRVTDSPVSYPFRIRDAGNGIRIPEVKVGDVWRSFTGDVDFLQITHANGAPLLDTQRIKIYEKLAKSATGLLHPESATWILIKSTGNVFNFDMKLNEFVRGGICAQFGPDGVARAVKFINDPKRSFFISKYLYRIDWEGGYVFPQGAAP
jgi:hypothetical protein